MGKRIGLLTSGGDCPGLNAALRGFGKAALGRYGMELIGFTDGFRGLVHDRYTKLGYQELSGILADGGTILGTSRDKPHKMPNGTSGKTRDMTEEVIDHYERHKLDCLVCLGGGGTQKNAARLQRVGLNVVTLPKTIDNDVACTDTSFGFDTALGIATEAVDRLHSTATSHNRVIVVEIMGHRAGWLALGSGLAGGADVILIPEIPYDIEAVTQAIKERARFGKHFSIIAVAEGAMDRTQHAQVQKLVDAKNRASGKEERRVFSEQLDEFHRQHTNHTVRLTEQLSKRTEQESRLTILGHLLRGGTPSPRDRVLATQLGTTAAALVDAGQYGVMVAVRGDELVPVPLVEVASKKKLVPLEHAWVQTARRVGASFGD